MPKVTLINPRNARTLYGDYGWQPLSLACLAGATPPGWDVEIIDEVITPIDPSHFETDLLALTAFTTQAPRAYAIASEARARGVHTAIGGVHATFMPDEAARFVDTVVTGEGELAWPRLLADFERGALATRYDGGLVSMDKPIVPRRDLLDPKGYTYASMQTTRGCPLDCSFCSVTAFNGRTFRTTTPHWAVSEMRRINNERVLIVDDDFNGFSAKARQRAIDVCDAIGRDAPGKRWITQVTINFGEDEALPKAAARAGCAAVFIGFESVSQSDLREISKKRYRGPDYFREMIARIRGAGIAIIGSFILGIEGQDINRTVDETLEFIDETQIDAFNPTILTPLPGTKDFARYSNSGRMIFDRFPEEWAFFNLSTPTIRSPAYSPAHLLAAYDDWMSFFEPHKVFACADRTRAQLGDAAAEASYLWNRAWTLHYRRALAMPETLVSATPASPIAAGARPQPEQT